MQTTINFQEDYPLPELLRGSAQLQTFNRTAIEIGRELFSAVQRIEREINPDTATEEGISRFEKMLSITPLQTDTLEERRSRIKASIFIIDRFTLDQRNISTRSVERNSFPVFVEAVTNPNTIIEYPEQPGGRSFSIKLTTASLKNAQILEKKLKELSPIDSEFSIIILFNRFSKYSGETFAAHSEETFIQLREKSDG